MAGSVVIIGSGPAGISAAIYAARANIKTTVITNGTGTIRRVGAIENYYGFPVPISGEKLHEAGIAQAKRLGVEIIEGEALDISYDFISELYRVTLADMQCEGAALIIATGAPQKSPKIENLEKFEGAGVSRCAVCDAFFYRQKAVAVYGAGEYAAHEAAELAAVADFVTVLVGSDSETETANFPENVIVVKKSPVSLRGEHRLTEIVLDDGSLIAAEGLFIALGNADSSAFAQKLGAETSDGKIVVDADCAAVLPGLYAAGDCAVIDGRKEPLQVARAVYMGETAGLSAVKFCRGKI